MSIRVVIAEDEAIIRLDLRETLEEEGYEVVGETGRGDQAVELVRSLKPDLAILDETDSGLDIDALRIVSEGVNSLRTPTRSFIVVTHYQRLLNHIVPDFVHVLAGGKIIRSGDRTLALELEKRGYDWLLEETNAA